MSPVLRALFILFSPSFFLAATNHQPPRRFFGSIPVSRGGSLQADLTCSCLVLLLLLLLLLTVGKPFFLFIITTTTTIIIIFSSPSPSTPRHDPAELVSGLHLPPPLHPPSKVVHPPLFTLYYFPLTYLLSRSFLFSRLLPYFPPYYHPPPSSTSFPSRLDLLHLCSVNL